MPVDRFVLLFLVFVAGYTMASIAPPRCKEPEPLDFSQPIKVVHTSSLHDPENVEYLSHRVVVDGEGRDVGRGPHHESAEVWRVEMAGGRVVLFGTRRPFE